GWLSPVLLLAVLAFLVLGVGSYHLLVARALRHLHAARAENDELMKHFRGLTEGMKELKAHCARRHAFLEKVLLATAQAYRRENAAGMTLYATAGSWGQLLFLIVIGLLLFALPGAVAVPWEARSGATLVILYVAAPLETILSWAPI